MGLAFAGLSYGKDEKPCLREFMNYLTNYGKNISKDVAYKLRKKIEDLAKTDKEKRDLVQICNLELVCHFAIQDSIDEVLEIFPNIVKSIDRAQIEELLDIIKLGK